MPKPEKAARIATLTTMLFMLGWESMLVLFPLKPFWRDEWCIIYNLKFKSPEMLWGQLDFTQQFPRVYLQIIKWFTAALNYNYFSLRFTSYVSGIAALVLGWRLMKRIYPQHGVNRYLFVLIFTSFSVFMDYFVQVKQYEMEMLLSLVAVWQLLELLEIPQNGVKRKWSYFLLCLSFAVVTFFSYTYPICIAPVFVIILMQNARFLTSKSGDAKLGRNLVIQWFPLLLGLAAMLVFYLSDVAQLMADQNMHNYWNSQKLPHGLTVFLFLKYFWLFFATVGSGFVFNIVFGILGIVSFFYSLIARPVSLKSDKIEFLRLYCLLLLIVAVGLFLANKLPLGEPKFDAFAVPAIAILIVFFLNNCKVKLQKAMNVFVLVLFISLSSNIFLGFINNFTSSEYLKRINIYHSTENAILLAHTKKIPVFITPAIGFPDDITAIIPFISMPSAAGVLKTFPAYNINDTIEIYNVKNMNLPETQVPMGIRAFLVGDGLNYRLVNR